jgi:RNA polymerase sigma-70 factor (ECF subfamily)
MDDGRSELLRRARDGDRAALGELLDGFRPYAVLLVRGLVGGRLQARMDHSDLVQDALLEAHRAFGGFRGGSPGELAAWLRAVVLRTAGHTLRAHRGTAQRDAGREQPLDPAAEPGNEVSPSSAADRHERSARLAAAMERLPDDMRLVLVGRHFDGLGYAELAGRLGRSEGAVRVLYTRALRRLREECQPP